MAISLKHNFTSPVADGGDTSLVQPSNWNAEHSLTLATSSLLGRTTAGTGAAEEISVGTGLNLSSGSLAVSSTTPQLNVTNTFTAAQIISVTDNTNAAFRITQAGTGNALLVEDSANPDSTPVVITADGNMSIGATSATAKLEVIGGVANSITALGTEDAATLAVTNSDVSGLGRIGKTLYQIGNLSVAAVAAVYSAFNAGGDIGGDLVFGTQTNLAGGVQERLRINRFGSFGIGGSNFGSSGQTIISAGSSTAPAWGTLGISGGGTGQTTAPAAINALTGYLAIVSAGGTTTLTNASPQVIYVSGTLNQTVVLPDVTTLQLGWSFVIINGSTGQVTLQSSGLNNLVNTVTAGITARVVCIATTGTTAASWALVFEGTSNRTGTGSIALATGPALFSPTLNNARYTLETITAGTNAQGQGAIASNTEIAAVTTTAANPSGVTLNTAAAGKRTTVFNLGTNPIVVYPPTGGVINALATNAGITLPVGYSLLFEAQTATQWRTQNLGTAGQFLESNGASSAPTWATISNTDISGLGTMSTQNANSVSITGGSITGITDLAVADGGTGASDAAGARTNLAVPGTGVSNTFTANQIISVTDNTNAALRITQTGTGNALLVEDSTNPDSSPLVVNADGQLLIGNTTAQTGINALGGGAIQVIGPGGADQSISVFAEVDLATTSGSVRQHRKRTTGAVVADDRLGIQQFAGFSGTNYRTAASLYAEQDGGTISDTSMAGRLVFATTPNGSTSASERFRIGSAGQLGIGGANYGTSGQFIRSAGSAAAPSWASIANTDVSGLGTMSTQNANSVSITGGSITGITDLAVADGGTGAASFTAYSVVLGGTTSTGPLQNVSGVGTSGQVLTSAGAGAAPTWAAPTAGSGALIRAPQILTSGTSYTTPAGCNSIYIEAVGGGGGSGGVNINTDGVQSGTGGGGAGAYAAKYFTVTPSTSYTYAIGAGGTAGTTGGNGGTGGSTTFTVSATTVTAAGGAGSTGMTNTTTATAGGAGGAGTNGDINIRGAGGGSGSAFTNHVTNGSGGGVGGVGGNSFFGGSGAGTVRGSAGVTVGTAGQSGGGASGTAVETDTVTESGTGAAGGAGLIRITEYT